MTDDEFRTLLDAISHCFIDNDFDVWERHVLRPFSMITRHGPVYLTTQEELKLNFEQYVEACKIMKLDQIYRRPISIESCQDGVFVGTYETQLLNKDCRAAEPYTASALIHNTSSGWRMSTIMGARGHHDETGFEPPRWETDTND